jgi:hypothetical protein
MITGINDFKNELISINNSISKLTEGLNTNSQTQQVIKGQVITNVQVTSKKGIEQQLNISNDRKLTLNSKIELLQDSVQKLELQIIEIEANNENTSELGPLKYLAQLTNYPMNKIVNWLILLIVIVFQPLAIMLILTSMFAFKNNHYVVRNSKKKVNKVSFFSNLRNKFKSVFEKSKGNSLINPIQNKDITSNKPKRVRKKKEFVIISPENLPTQEIPKVEPVPKKVKKQKSNSSSLLNNIVDVDIQQKRRKVVDTNLTADLANHIANSLPNKKKI